VYAGGTDIVFFLIFHFVCWWNFYRISTIPRITVVMDLLREPEFHL
jgi:hypothetical protein